MSADDVESILRARLAAGIDPLVPGRPAEDRVMHAIIENASPRRDRGLRAALLAAAVGLTIGGAIGVSFVALHDRATGGNQHSSGQVPPPGTNPPSASPAPSESPTPSPGPQHCDDFTAFVDVAHSAGAAGTQGFDIVLHSSSSLPCTVEGYANIAGISNGNSVTLGVTHSIGGTLLNNNNGTLPTSKLITVPPGGDVYIAVEYSTVNSGPSPCPSFSALLITPPQGSHSVTVPAPGLMLCGGHGAAIWIDEAPVSAVPYFTHP